MQTLLCDIGGVLLNVDFDRAINRLSDETGYAGEVLLEKIFSSGDKDRHDRGEISSHDFYRRILPEKEITYDRFESLWGDIFSEKHDMVDLITSLGETKRLIIASNTDPIHFSFFQKNYQWFSLFDDYGLSYELKQLKPSPEFYADLCRKFDVPLREALFVDDLRENVEAAKRLGIRAHWFRDVERFKMFLKQ